MEEQNRGRLTIEIWRAGFGVNTLKITGFTEAEMEELKHCDYRDLKTRVVEIADERNGNIGTCWTRGYGIYNAWTNDNAVFIEVGSSSD